MIALIGPSDSVNLTQRVALQMGLESLVIPLVYKDPAEAAELAAKARNLATIVLFTGRFPYFYSRFHYAETMQTTYIAYDGTELFRALAALSLTDAYQGTIPPVSFDTVVEREVAEAYAELSLDSPYRIVPIHSDGTETVLSPETVASSHEELFRAGEVQHCLTTISKVYELLVSKGIPAARLLHSATSVRHALMRAKLMLDLSRSEMSQPVVCLLRPSTGPFDLSRFEAFTSNFCRLVSGRIIGESAAEVVMMASLGMIEHHLMGRLVSVPRSEATTPPFSIFIGKGADIQKAELNARGIVPPATQSLSFLKVGTDNAQINFSSHSRIKKSIKETVLSKQSADLYPHFIERIGVVSRQLGQNFTAAEFAKLYGVTPRSARRIIAIMKDRELIYESGLKTNGSVGRPKRVYKLSVSKLSELLADLGES